MPKLEKTCGYGKMLRMKKIIYLLIFIVSIVLGIAAYKKLTHMGASGTGIEIDWRLLSEMDYVTGKIPDSLKKIDGQYVKMPGFMVPLEDSQKSVTEFLLVPSPQACIHVPPPPPNQMIYVKMVGEGVPVPWGPIWVKGKMNIVTKNSMYGDASFEIQAESIEEYK